MKKGRTLELEITRLELVNQMADKPTANRWQTIQTKKYQKKDKVKKETTTKKHGE